MTVSKQQIDGTSITLCVSMENLPNMIFFPFLRLSGERWKVGCGYCQEEKRFVGNAWDISLQTQLKVTIAKYFHS